MTPNHVKQRIRNGRPAFGSLLNFGDPLVAEMMASVGFDWLVRSCKYPPQGVRSLGAGRFPLSFKTEAATYFQRANDEILVIVQIEHHEAIKNIDAILSVPGVDACYVGPNDFCASLGLAPSLEPPHREFHEAMAVLLAACRRYGVVPGIHCRTTETVNRRIAEGWPLVGMINDQGFLTTAARAARDAVKTDA